MFSLYLTGFAKLDELSVGFRTLRLSAPQKMPQKAPAPNVATLRDFNSNQPISKIPIELLCEIFTKFVNDPTISRIENPTGPLVSRHSSVDPTILGQVCSRWRDTALNLPTLWSTICIRNPAKSQLYRTHLWLERSADQPLNLTLEDGIEGRDLNATWNIVRAFYSHADKWRRIDFSVPPDLLASIGHLGQDAPPCKQLESIQFRTTNPVSDRLRQLQARSPNWENPYLDSVWSFFHSSPSLQEVCYTVKRSDLLPRNTPFVQLTSVSIDFTLSPDVLLGALSQFPNLYSIRANIDSTEFHPPQSVARTACPIITLKHLRTAELFSGRPLTQFFQHLTLPSLETLLLTIATFFDGKSISHHSALQSLLQRSNCCLKKLQFIDRQMNEDDACIYLETPELQALSFLEFGANLSTKFISLLSQTNLNGSHQNLPALQELHLGNTTNTPDGMLSQMIAGRLPVLKRFNIMTKSGGYGPIDEAFFESNY
ncbi:hypothetical protein NLJ89_g5104 [Agrocybe chaxingu]|uniref:F-box domain-containing protein n=1 Tax=Agrocybe chaxingu TaxID=84603 RepID=A0A9W8K2W9_9AGAR|nr:hypothetical protein NLJ89_g5104 [Agrocybe chaxingu]